MDWSPGSKLLDDIAPANIGKHDIAARLNYLFDVITYHRKLLTNTHVMATFVKTYSEQHRWSVAQMAHFASKIVHFRGIVPNYDDQAVKQDTYDMVDGGDLTWMITGKE